MSVHIDEIKKLLSAVPRVSLGFFPTPMYRLDKLSAELGINLYIKRDDFTGKNQFGGNKTRKLEFLIGKAVEDKCEYVFTYGATQSNHAMQTVWSAVSNGLKPVLYLVAVVAPDENDIKANLLLDKIFGAEIHIVSMKENETFLESEMRSFAIGADHISRLEAAGHKCMDIPLGGANAIGSAAYIEGFAELQEQATDMGIKLDYLYHSSGSGGTMAGLVAGEKLLGTGVCIQSIAALEPDDGYIAGNVALANAAIEYIGAAGRVEEGDFPVNTAFYLPGYESPSESGTEAIKLLARTEGLLLDPVYTAKAFAALLHDVRTGKIAKGSNVVFLHTGGATALFAEKQILGDIF